MMRGFYVLAIREKRKKCALVLAGVAAAASLFFAVRTCKAPEAVAASVPQNEPYVAMSDDGRLVVTRGGELVVETNIDVRSLPEHDRVQLEQGITVADSKALAHLLEDYGS